MTFVDQPSSINHQPEHMPAEGRTFFNIAQIDLLPQVQSVLKKYERYAL